MRLRKIFLPHRNPPLLSVVPSAWMHKLTAGPSPCASTPHCTDTVQDRRGRRTNPKVCVLPAQLDLVSRAHADGINPSLRNLPEEGSSFSWAGHNLAPVFRILEPPYQVSELDEKKFRGLPLAMVDIITQASTPSTRGLYALKWCLFAMCCSSRGMIHESEQLGPFSKKA